LIKLSYESSFDAPVDDLFNWHETAGAFERLNPAYEPVQLISHTGGIKDGAIVKIKILPPLYLPSFLGIKWTLTHKNYIKNNQFEDHQLVGPFAKWQHRHLFKPIGHNRSILTDDIQFSLPLGYLSEPLLGWFFKSKLNKLFAYRHRITKCDLEVISKYKNCFETPQRILVSGASGLVGKSLVGFLKLAGHQVFKLSRVKTDDPDSIFWDPYSRIIDTNKLSNIDHFIHLAGENVGQRWTKKIKNKILSSRIDTTKFLVDVIKSLSSKPKSFICASASGFYGINQLSPQDENCQKGSGFLSDVVKEWEDATIPLKQIGVRVCNPRISVILSPEGGALYKLLPAFLLGVGGPIGLGKNFMSCISKDDLIYAIYHLIATPNIEGPVNMALPEPAPTNKQFSNILAKTLKRPCIFAVPPFVLKLVFGEMAQQTILSSTNLSVKKLIDSGFEFKYPTLSSVFKFNLGTTKFNEL
jgi:uncharacterized protein (TIGR01777 family)